MHCKIKKAEQVGFFKVVSTFTTKTFLAFSSPNVVKMRKVTKHFHYSSYAIKE